MKELVKTINIKDKSIYTIDSREVAKMLEKEHEYVLEMIQGRKGKLGIIPVLENAKLAVSDFFTESRWQ